MLGKTNVDWNTVLNNYLDRILEMAGNIVVAILIIVIGFKLIKMLIRFLKTALEKGDIDYGVISFSCSFVRGMLLTCMPLFAAHFNYSIRLNISYPYHF